MAEDARVPYETLSAILFEAESAARQAGAHMKRNLGSAIIKTKSGPADLLTKVDGECEAIIKEVQKRAYPHHGFLGEEMFSEMFAPGSAESKSAIKSAQGLEWLWIVDPIDGTTNFTHGFPASVVSVAVAHKGTVMVAAIFDPYRSEMFSCRRGDGAIMINGEPFSLPHAPASSDAAASNEDTDEAALADALVAYGMKRAPRFRAPTMRALEALGECTHGCRNLGAAALHLAWVAAGRLDAFYQLDLCPWDLAAGQLLVAEASGEGLRASNRKHPPPVSDTRGKPYALETRDICVAGSRALHRALLALLKRVNAHSAED
jgi:myo-inositol-1(or 4)-monophosphatase